MSPRTWVRRAASALGLAGTTAILLIQACTSESVSGVDIGSVRVSPSSSVVLEGLSVQFEAVVYDETGAALPGAVVTWSSDREEVARVDGDGLATGVATGETTIRASFNDTEAAANLMVQPGPDVGVSPPSVTLYGGASEPAPGPATVRLTNEGGGIVGTLTVTLLYPQGEPGGWLRADLSSATVPTDLTLTATSTALAVGRHRATVTITSSNAEADDTPVTVPVTLSLTAFTVTPSAGGTRVAESGTTDSLRVALLAAPTSDVRLLVTSADTSEARVSPAALTFTPSSWAVPQIVTVTPADDSEVDGDRTTVVTVSVDDGGSDVAYRPALARTASVTTVDDDAAGFVVAETAGGTRVTEARGSDSLTVVLRTRPASDVVITASASDGGEATVAPTTLTFRPVDWDVPRTVTVTGVDDALVDGIQTSTVTLRVDRSRSHATYQGLPDQLVSVTTLDDDGAGLRITESQGSTVVTEAETTDAFTVVLTAQPTSDVALLVTSADIGEASVGPATLTFTPADWNTAQPVSVRGVDDALVDGAVVTVVTVSVDASRSASDYRGVASGTLAVTTLDDDGAAFAVVETGSGTAVSESGTSDVFDVVLAAQPVSNVVLRLASGDPAEAVVSPQSLTFNASNWGQAQTVTVTGVDDDLTDGDQVTAITINVDAAASDDAFDAVAARTVAATTADDDAAGFTLGGTVGLAVTEGVGTNAHFSVVLTARPTTSVELTVASGDTGEATVSPATLTFTSASWNVPLTVTLTGVDDAALDGDQVTTVTVAVNQAASDDAFDGVGSEILTVTTRDDDAAGLTLADTSALTVTEAGGTDEFSVALSVAPAANVVLRITSGNPSEALVDPSALTFTSADWNLPQVVTLTGVNDAVADGPRQTVVTVEVDDVQSDPAFGGLSATAQVTTTDDDAVGVTVSPDSLNVVEGDSAVFTVRLTSEPTSQVVFDVSIGGPPEVTVAPPTLTFTTGNWAVPQRVTVTGVENVGVGGNPPTGVAIVVRPAESDPAYGSGVSREVTVTVTDNDGGP